MGAKILIVDDEPNTLGWMTHALKFGGYEVVTAEDGETALSKAETEQPDLMLLDVRLADACGVEVCQRLRSKPQTADLPIIMVSALTQVPDRVRGLQAGADDYVTKPVAVEELLARVERLLLRAAKLKASMARAKMLALVGAKGGVGTTTVAVNLALGLTQHGKRVILVDLHSCMGCVCRMLGLDLCQGWTELAQTESRSIRRGDIERRLARHSSGLQVLGSEELPPEQEQRELTSEQAEAMLDELSTMAEWVLFDLPLQLHPASESVLGRCDFVTVVTEADPLALRCAKDRLALLQRRGIPRDMVGVVVVNRTPSAMTMAIDQLEDRLGAAIVGVMPPAAEACLHALSHGTPLIQARPDHLAAEMLNKMVQGLV